MIPMPQKLSIGRQEFGYPNTATRHPTTLIPISSHAPNTKRDFFHAPRGSLASQLGSGFDDMTPPYHPRDAGGSDRLRDATENVLRKDKGRFRQSRGEWKVA